MAVLTAEAGDRLADFLRGQSRRCGEWRPSNCLLLPADWLVFLGLPDPASEWRDRTDQPEAVLAEAGGTLALAAAAMTRIGAVPTHAVRRGDVGLVTVMGVDGPDLAGGICTGARWAVRGPRGLWIGRAEPMAAWSVADGRWPD